MAPCCSFHITFPFSFIDLPFKLFILQTFITFFILLFSSRLSTELHIAMHTVFFIFHKNDQVQFELIVKQSSQHLPAACQCIWHTRIAFPGFTNFTMPRKDISIRLVSLIFIHSAYILFYFGYSHWFKKNFTLLWTLGLIRQNWIKLDIFFLSSFARFYFQQSHADNNFSNSFWVSFEYLFSWRHFLSFLA